MTRVLRWVAALFLGSLSLAYLAAVLTVLPLWAVLIAGVFWGWLLSRFIRRRRGTSLAGQYRETPADA